MIHRSSINHMLGDVRQFAMSGLIGAVLMPLLLFPVCGIFEPILYSGPADISYLITGGFAGVHEETDIDEDGHARLILYTNDVRRCELSLERLDDLKKDFRRAHFFRLKKSYKPSQPIMDGFYYTITYATEGRTKTVRVEDGANISDTLQKLLEALHDTNYYIKSQTEEESS